MESDLDFDPMSEDNQGHLTLMGQMAGSAKFARSINNGGLFKASMRALFGELTHMQLQYLLLIHLLVSEYADDES